MYFYDYVGTVKKNGLRVYIKSDLGEYLIFNYLPFDLQTLDINKARDACERRKIRSKFYD